MKNAKRVRTNGSAATVKPQSTNQAVSAPSITAAHPKDESEAGRENSSKQGQHRLNAPLSVNLALWADKDISDLEALIYMAEAVCENEAAFFEFARKSDPITGHLVILSVAKGIGYGEGFENWRERIAMAGGKMSFPDLPGLLGRWTVTVREVLFYMTCLLINARELIPKTILPAMKDRKKAVKLAEALALACAQWYRDTEETEGRDEAESLARKMVAEAMIGDVPSKAAA
jgi:hypothetical protein